jgi:acyl-CoA synthetase (AMP-forming)/AMP-acid ligase II
MISSAPARKDTKLAILEHFSNGQLYELYGSTEAGWVTLLRPEQQIDKLGSVGREWAGSGAIRLLDPEGHVRRWLSSPAELSRRLWAATRTCPDEPGPDGLLARCACERCLGDESEQCAAVAAEAEQQVKLSGWCPRGG